MWGARPPPRLALALRCGALARRCALVRLRWKLICPRRAQAISDLKLQLSDTKRVAGILSDAQTALELLGLQDAQEEEGSTELLHEAGTSLHHLEAALDAWELERLLDMPYASSGAVLTITAGAGGTDAQDWAEMLSRMYERWATAQGFTCKVRAPAAGCACVAV